MTEKSLLIFSFVFKLYLRKNCFLVKTFHSCDLTYSAVYLLSPVAFIGTATPVKNMFIYIREYMGTIAAISLVPVSKLCWESVRGHELSNPYCLPSAGQKGFQVKVRKGKGMQAKQMGTHLC